MNDKLLEIEHRLDRTASKAAKYRRALVETHNLLRDTLHAHKRGDKEHVVTDHLERTIDALTAALATTHN